MMWLPASATSRSISARSAGWAMSDLGANTARIEELRERTSAQLGSGQPLTRQSRNAVTAIALR